MLAFLRRWNSILYSDCFALVLFFHLRGFFIWVHIQPSISMKSLYSRALKRGILLNSGSIYAQETGSYLRLSYAYASLPDIDRSIKILAELIRELQV